MTKRTQIPEYKVCMVGYGGVGKSAATLQFVQGLFVEDLDPTIEDSYRKQVRIDDDDEIVILDILDMAGPEEYVPLVMQNFRFAHGFLVFFSLTDHYSMYEAIKYLEMIKRAKEETDMTKIPTFLIGNKLDLVDERVISRDEALDLAKNYKLQYMETSAKMNENVTECFLALARMMMTTCPQPTVATGQKRCRVQ